MSFKRVILIVLDSVGIGAMPDADRFGDAGSDTLGNILSHRFVSLPNMARLGLGNIRRFPRIPPAMEPAAAYGMAALGSNGKDTTSGHWEMAGIVLKNPFPTYPNGFPRQIIDAFENAIGRSSLGNISASGTEIIEELGAEHLKTGFPIVYTSADSVFQIAAHEDAIPCDELYRICQKARALLKKPHEVGRVIARPFVGEPGNFIRTVRRRDFAIPPPGPTLLDRLKESGHACVGIGKIASIFCGCGITREVKTKNNEDGVDCTLESMKEVEEGLIFTNLVDFDMLYGHRNNVDGYAEALEAFDRRVPALREALRPDDCLILTADHGCDPTTEGTDHSREHVPILAVGLGVRAGATLGLRRSLADIGQTIAGNFNLSIGVGESFLTTLAL